MKISCTLALLALSFASPALYAEESLGRVRGVYVEAARGVLVDQKFRSSATSSILWADVELSAAPEGRRVLVQVPAELKPASGDLVAVQVEDSLPRMVAQQVPMLRVSRITEVRTRAFAGLGSASAGASK
jgi:hypothetical protein